jgi:hypothetical protein
MSPWRRQREGRGGGLHHGRQRVSWGSLRCSCDPYLNVLPPDGTPCFCTLVQFATCDIAPANYCGQGATCCGYHAGRFGLHPERLPAVTGLPGVLSEIDPVPLLGAPVAGLRMLGAAASSPL